MWWCEKGMKMSFCSSPQMKKMGSRGYTMDAYVRRRMSSEANTGKRGSVYWVSHRLFMSSLQTRQPLSLFSLASILSYLVLTQHFCLHSRLVFMATEAAAAHRKEGPTNNQPEIIAFSIASCPSLRAFLLFSSSFHVAVNLYEYHTIFFYLSLSHYWIALLFLRRTFYV